MKDPLDKSDAFEQPRQFDNVNTVGKLREKLESLIAEGRITDDTQWYTQADDIVLLLKPGQIIYICSF